MDRVRVKNFFFQKAFPWLLFGGVLYLYLAFGRGGQNVLDEGTEVPDLRVQLATGDIFDLTAHRGEVIVLNFWASWCPPCRSEAPDITRIHRYLQERGGQVVALAAESDSLASLVAKGKSIGLEVPIGLATYRSSAEFGADTLPTTYVINKEGKVADVFVGAVSYFRLKWAVDAALE